MKNLMTLEQVQEAAKSVLGRESWALAGPQGNTVSEATANFWNLKAAADAGDFRARAVVQEAMHSDSFPNVLGDTMNREVQEKYTSWPRVWDKIAARRTFRDYRVVRVFEPMQINGRMQRVGSYEANMEERVKTDRSAVTYRVDDYAAYAQVNREAIINDDMGEFDGIPDDFAEAAGVTEDYLFTATHFDASGPTGLTQLTSNPVFGVNGLKAALAQVMKTRHPDSDIPVMWDAPVLEVGPDLAIDAQEVIRAASIELTPSLGATARAIMTENWITQFIKSVVVNPWIPVIATSNAATSWCLFQKGRIRKTAIEVGFLQGYETPRVYVKAPNQQRVGGGLAPITEGTFENPNIEYKCVHTVAAKLVNAKYGFMSNGTGS